MADGDESLTTKIEGRRSGEASPCSSDSSATESDNDGITERFAPDESECHSEDDTTSSKRRSRRHRAVRKDFFRITHEISDDEEDDVVTAFTDCINETDQSSITANSHSLETTTATCKDIISNDETTAPLTPHVNNSELSLASCDVDTTKITDTVRQAEEDAVNATSNHEPNITIDETTINVKVSDETIENNDVNSKPEDKTNCDAIDGNSVDNHGEEPSISNNDDNADCNGLHDKQSTHPASENEQMPHSEINRRASSDISSGDLTSNGTKSQSSTDHRGNSQRKIKSGPKPLSPLKGKFYQHDQRKSESKQDEATTESMPERRNVPMKTRSNTSKRWGHDCYDADEQRPKTKDEIIACYGYDIRKEKEQSEQVRKPSSKRRSTRPKHDAYEDERYYDWQYYGHSYGYSRDNRQHGSNRRGSAQYERKEDNRVAVRNPRYDRRPPPPSRKSEPTRTRTDDSDNNNRVRQPVKPRYSTQRAQRNSPCIEEVTNRNDEVDDVKPSQEKNEGENDGGEQTQVKEGTTSAAADALRTLSAMIVRPTAPEFVPRGSTCRSSVTSSSETPPQAIQPADRLLASTTTGTPLSGYTQEELMAENARLRAQLAAKVFANAASGSQLTMVPGQPPPMAPNHPGHQHGSPMASAELLMAAQVLQQQQQHILMADHQQQRTWQMHQLRRQMLIQEAMQNGGQMPPNGTASAAHLMCQSPAGMAGQQPVAQAQAFYHQPVALVAAPQHQHLAPPQHQDVLLNSGAEGNFMRSG